MKVTARKAPLGGAAALAVPVLPAEDGIDLRLGEGADALADLPLDPMAALAAAEATGKAGEVTTLPVHRDGVETVLLVGVGDGSERSLRRAAAAAVRAARDRSSLATTLATGRDATAARVVAEAFGLASYRFSRRSEDEPPALRECVIVVDRPASVRRELARAATVVRAVSLARDLANTPSLVKSPQWLAEQAVEVCQPSGVTATVLDERQLAERGFGGVLAVGSGSARPPRLVELRYEPAKATRHVVLVGKGITFDSGGLSLKPAESMVSMKTDMAGGAAVIATMSALADLGVAVRVTGLVPMAENMPGADALRPGDVVTHYGGISSEVLNTDAEGRVVLADALAYATAELQPNVVVDIATLTGAASLGLGRRHGALYASTPALSGSLLAAAQAAGERLWQMPLVEDYRDAMDSDIADLRNIARENFHYGGGSITAALFLREFVRGCDWAHLDVAGPARAESDEDEVTKGATGFGVRTFLRWLETLH